MKKTKATGRLIARILRHCPSMIGIELDENGWADTLQLIDGINKLGRDIDFDTLKKIVAQDGKSRFSFNGDMSKVRAVQGHSIAVDLQLQEKIPPEFLYHGTADKYMNSIKSGGIQKKKRNFVHLSLNEETAVKVGSRHGVPVILKINSRQMEIDGYKFFVAQNGVWLTDFVPFEYVVEIIR